MDKQDEGLRLLKNIQHINRMIEELQMDIDAIYTSLTNTTVKPKEIDVQTSLPSDPMADKIIKVIEYEKKLEAYQLELIEAKSIVMETIMQMDINNQQYIVLKYFRSKTIEEIGEIVGYAFRQTWENIHKAEQEFISIYEKSA